MNGIAGGSSGACYCCAVHHSLTCGTQAFSEHVPIVHIVGVPNTEQQKNKPLLHHTLGDGRYIVVPESLLLVLTSH